MRARFVASLALAAALLGVGAVASAARAPSAALVCTSCDEWNVPHAPVRVFGDTYYVGVTGISALLVKTRDGLVLLDGGLPQSALHIAHNVAALGFSLRDIKTILVSHAHGDHVGGLFALQAMTGARVFATPGNVAALERGAPTEDDPQHEAGHGVSAAQFPPVRNATSLGDRRTITRGDVTFTAYDTPGHSPGGTTWTWKSCDGTRCLDVVYADSLNPISSPEYRFTDHPELVAQLRRSIDLVEQLPCDILVTVHPDLAALDGDRLVDSMACRAYAQRARHRLEERLASEAGK